MHPEFKESYILTFYPSIFRKNGYSYKGNYTVNFKNIHFSFNINQSFSNNSKCHGIIANNFDITYQINNKYSTGVILKKHKPLKIIFPKSCLLKNKVNKIVYSLYQPNKDNQLLQIDNINSTGALNIFIPESFNYRINLLNSAPLIIQNPLVYYIIPSGNEWFIHESLKEKITIFNKISLNNKYSLAINSLFKINYSFNYKEFYIPSWENDEIMKKIFNQYANSLLTFKSETEVYEKLLNNEMSLKWKNIKNYYQYNKEDKTYNHFFQENLHINNFKRDFINQLILPYNLDNWKGLIKTKLQLNTIDNTNLIFNVNQPIKIKNSLIKNKNLLISLKSTDKFLNNFIYDDEDILLINSEKVRMWYVQDKISWKEYENFIIKGE